MKRHIRFLACLALTTCCLVQVDFVRADEREELKARIAELENEVKRFLKEGTPDEVVRLNRERSELMQKLIRLQRESQQESKSEGQGRGGKKHEFPDMPPELMEKMERAKQQINHLRIASEHLKMAQKHDMAHDLMRQAEEIERDVHQAIAQQKNHQVEKQQLDRQRAERMEKQRREAMAERERQAEQRKEFDRRENDKERQAPERAFVRPRIEPPMSPPKVREEAMQGLQKEIKQLREENREIRQMMERISQELKRMQSRD